MGWIVGWLLLWVSKSEVLSSHAEILLRLARRLTRLRKRLVREDSGVGETAMFDDLPALVAIEEQPIGVEGAIRYPVQAQA